MSKRLFVNFKKYNNCDNVKFVMTENDFDWRNKLIPDNIENLGTVNIINKKFSHKGKQYQHFSDWSVSEI